MAADAHMEKHNSTVKRHLLLHLKNDHDTIFQIRFTENLNRKRASVCALLSLPAQSPPLLTSCIRVGHEFVPTCLMHRTQYEQQQPPKSGPGAVVAFR